MCDAVLSYQQLRRCNATISLTSSRSSVYALGFVLASLDVDPDGHHASSDDSDYRPMPNSVAAPFTIACPARFSAQPGQRLRVALFSFGARLPVETTPAGLDRPEQVWQTRLTCQFLYWIQAVSIETLELFSVFHIYPGYTSNVNIKRTVFLKSCPTDSCTLYLIWFYAFNFYHWLHVCICNRVSVCVWTAFYCVACIYFIFCCLWRNKIMFTQ